MQLSTIMGHRFHSLGLLEPFSCAFITNSQEWRLYWRIMPLTILRKMFPFSFGSEKPWEYIFRKIYLGLAGFLHVWLTSFKECFVIEVIYSTTQVTYEKMKCRNMKTKTVSFSLVAIKFPFGLPNYWEKNFLIPLIGLNRSVCFSNFFCWVTREVLFQQSGKHQYQLSSE